MTTKTLTISTVVSILLLQVIAVSAQSADEQATSESNIVCLAAKKKWVCAPADELPKAEEKARLLALEPEEPDTVEIQTLQPVNVGQQVRNEQTSYTIQDFVARDDVLNEADETTQSNTNTNEVDEDASSSVDEAPATIATNNKVVSIEQVSEPVNDTREYQTAPTNFNYWQKNFSQQWTFQVVGTSNRHHIDGFIQQHGLEDANYTIVKTQRDGADWWIVLTGLYSSRDQAKSQQHTLPSALANGAWVRQISSIEGQSG
jgi:septal ring-binding cell division protein DamX